MGGNAVSIPHEVVRRSKSYDEGAKAVREGRYTVAEVVFQRVLHEHPGYAFWQTLLSACVGSTQDATTAVADEGTATVGQTVKDESDAAPHNHTSGDEAREKDDVTTCTASRDEASHTQKASHTSARDAVRLVQLPLDDELEAIVDYVRLAANIVLLYLESPPDDRNCAIAMLYCEFVCIHTELLLHLLALHETRSERSKRVRAVTTCTNDGRAHLPLQSDAGPSTTTAPSETVMVLVDVNDDEDDDAEKDDAAMSNNVARDAVACAATTASDKRAKSAAARRRVVLLLGQQLRYYWVSCLTLYTVLALPYATRLQSTTGAEGRQRTRILTSCLENCRAMQSQLLRFAVTHASNYINAVVLRHMPRSALRDLHLITDAELHSVATDDNDDEAMTPMSNPTRSVCRTAATCGGRSMTASAYNPSHAATATVASASTKNSAHGVGLLRLLTDGTLGGQLTFLQLARRMRPNEPLQLPLTNVLPVRLAFVAHRSSSGNASRDNSDATTKDNAAAVSLSPHCDDDNATRTSSPLLTLTSPRLKGDDDDGDDDDDATFAHIALATLRSPAERLTYLYLGFTLAATPFIVPGGTNSLMARSLPTYPNATTTTTPMQPVPTVVLLVRPTAKTTRRRSRLSVDVGGRTYHVVRDLAELTTNANGEKDGDGAHDEDREEKLSTTPTATTAAAATTAGEGVSLWAKMRAALHMPAEQGHSLQPYLSPPLNRNLQLQDDRTLLTLCAEENFLLFLPVTLLTTMIDSFMNAESTSSLFSFAALSVVEELYGTESLLYQFARREVFNACSESALTRLLTEI